MTSPQIQIEATRPRSDLRIPGDSQPARWAFLYLDSVRDLPGIEGLKGGEGISESWDCAPHHLEVLAESMLTFTPNISLAQSGIWLEIGQSAHLFGGEESTVHKALLQAQALGFRGCAVVADQPETARVLGKTLAMADRLDEAAPFLVPRGADARVLASLPISVLEPSGAARRLLEDLGISDLGQLARISPPSLRCRLGPEGAHLTERARAEPCTPPPRYLPPDQPLVALEFEPALSGYEPLQFVFKRLLDDLVAVAAGRGMAIDALRLEIHPAGGALQRVDLPLARPSQSAASLLSLVREFLQAVERDPGASGFGALGISRVAFQILRMAQQSEEQGSLFDGGAQIPARGAELLTRLEASLGADAIYGASLRSNYRPEQSWASTSFSLLDQKRSPHKSSSSEAHTEEEERPIFLFVEPCRIEGAIKLGEILRWSGGSGPGGSGVVRAIWGPERLRASWWEQPLVRDYYVVELSDGARLWIFRHLESKTLYLHGLFD